MGPHDANDGQKAIADHGQVRLTVEVVCEEVAALDRLHSINCLVLKEERVGVVKPFVGINIVLVLDHVRPIQPEKWLKERPLKLDQRTVPVPAVVLELDAVLSKPGHRQTIAVVGLRLEARGLLLQLLRQAL